LRNQVKMNDLSGKQSDQNQRKKNQKDFLKIRKQNGLRKVLLFEQL